MNALLDKSSVPSKFDRIATTYDALTGANPGYGRNLEASARTMGIADGGRLLDLCCGTGASTAALRAVYPTAEITGLDASAGMLDRARTKTSLGATFVHGDAMNPAATPGVDGTYDGIFMAYGIRNMPDADVCLARVRELLAPGGVVVFHEYSVEDDWRTRLIWTLVCWGIIIPGGLLTARSTDIYRYLWRSALDFDGPLRFVERLRAHGYTDVRTSAMTGWQRGIVHTFTARRPDQESHDRPDPSRSSPPQARA